MALPAALMDVAVHPPLDLKALFTVYTAIATGWHRPRTPLRALRPNEENHHT
jgi:hypothetical protein